MNERQAFALNNPCQLLEDCGQPGYSLATPAGNRQLVTVLTIDLFLHPWRWHAAVGFLDSKGQPVSCARWNHNDRSAAVELGRELLAGVGDGPQEGGLGAFGEAQLHLKRDLAADERCLIEAYTLGLPMLTAPEQRWAGSFQIVDPYAVR